MKTITVKLDLSKKRDILINDFLGYSKKVGFSTSETVRQAIEFMDGMRIHNPKLYGMGLTLSEKIEGERYLAEAEQGQVKGS